MMAVSRNQYNFQWRQLRKLEGVPGNQTIIAHVLPAAIQGSLIPAEPPAAALQIEDGQSGLLNATARAALLV